METHAVRHSSREIKTRSVLSIDQSKTESAASLSDYDRDIFNRLGASAFVFTANTCPAAGGGADDCIQISAQGYS